jgi:hypothetical protein
VALPVMSVGAYLFLKEKQRAMGAVVALVAVGWLLVTLIWIVPSYSVSGTYPRASLYGALGGTIPEAIKCVMTHPGRAVPYIFSWQALKYLAGLLLPLLFLPLLRLDIWLLVLPVLLQNLFTGNPGENLCFRWPAGQWSAPTVTFTFMAAIYALRDIEKRLGEQWVGRVVGGAMVVSLFLAIRTASAPQIWADPVMKEFVEGVQERVPAGVRLSSDCPYLLTNDFGRNRVSVFPCGVERADFVSITLIPDPEAMKMMPKAEYYPRFLQDSRFQQIWSVEDPKGRRKMLLFRRMPDRHP